jgi:glycogen operon protein
MVFNAYWKPLNFRIPSSPSGRPWRRAVDTALPSPDDALGLDEGPTVTVGHAFRVEARSMIILVSEA